MVGGFARSTPQRAGTFARFYSTGGGGGGDEDGSPRDGHVVAAPQGRHDYPERMAEEGQQRPVFLHPSGEEVVKVNDAFVPRFAFRGVTPPQLADHQAGRGLSPRIPLQREGSAGFHYFGDGTEKERAGGTDTEWASKIGGMLVAQLPDAVENPKAFAFMQARKGANKALSLSSSRIEDIHSNSGGSFGLHGLATVDLAKVPDRDESGAPHILYHHQQEPLSWHDVRPALGIGPLTKAADERVTAEVERANETIARNREVIASTIPQAAIMEMTPVKMAPPKTSTSPAKPGSGRVKS